MLRHIGGILSGRSAGIYRRLEAIDPRQSRGHLRADRADRTTPVRGAAGQDLNLKSVPAISGAWTNGFWTGGAGRTHPLSFEKADRELCFNRIRKELVMPDAEPAFSQGGHRGLPEELGGGVRCAVMQGGQGDVKHWAFNDPPRRTGKYKNKPPTPGGISQAHDPHRRSASHHHRAKRPHFTAAAISPWCRRRRITRRPGRKRGRRRKFPSGTREARQSFRPATDDVDDLQKHSRCAVPMSFFADHPNVQFNFYRRESVLAPWKCTNCADCVRKYG